MLIQILTFLALLIIPLGILISIAWTCRWRNKRKSHISDEDIHKVLGFIELLKIRRNVLLLSSSILALFPLLFLLYQLIHGPNVNPYLFLVGYLLFSFCIVVIIAISYLQISNGKFLLFGISSTDICLTFAGLLSTSLYIAWIAVFFMETVGNAWRGNVAWENIIDGLFGIVVGTLCIVLLRISTLKFESQSLYLLFSLLAVSLISWIIFDAKAGMPLYLSMPRIMQFPEYYSIRVGDVVKRLTFLFQAILCQVFIPLIMMQFLVRLISRKRISI